MRKLDLLIIRAFIGPFVLTTAVSTFILLIQHMLKYFEDFVGKDLGISVFAELLFYFSLNMLQVALPLGVLVSSLMTFGNLGENFELTAIKSAGISLVRALRPIFMLVLLISIGAFFFNDNVLPAANLKAYSLLYDIKHKKPTMDLQEGVFYKGIPDYTIKVKEKLPDDITLKDVIIYDHTTDIGNRRVILADSSRMFLFMNDRYLKLELFDGNYYSEDKVRGNPIDQFNRTNYSRMDMVFSLASFEFDPTDEELFRGNRQMMNSRELTHAIDSMQDRITEIRNGIEKTAKMHFTYFQSQRQSNRFKRGFFGETSMEQDMYVGPIGFTHLEEIIKKLEVVSDSTMDELPLQRNKPARTSKPVKKPKIPERTVRLQRDTIPNVQLADLKLSDLDSIIDQRYSRRNQIIHSALTQSRNVKNAITSTDSREDNIRKQLSKYVIEKYKKYSQAFACIVMFLIGAPLGSIIKKGGLGVPVIISIFFFIVYYVLSISGEEYAKAEVMDGKISVWLSNIILLPVGLFFLRQARIDARLFDKDIYIIWWDKMKAKYRSRKKLG
jgi:lipopolysaccharide export system permease protein